MNRFSAHTSRSDHLTGIVLFADQMV